MTAKSDAALGRGGPARTGGLLGAVVPAGQVGVVMGVAAGEPGVGGRPQDQPRPRPGGIKRLIGPAGLGVGEQPELFAQAPKFRFAKTGQKSPNFIRIFHEVPTLPPGKRHPAGLFRPKPPQVANAQSHPTLIPPPLVPPTTMAGPSADMKASKSTPPMRTRWNTRLLRMAKPDT